MGKPRRPSHRRTVLSPHPDSFMMKRGRGQTRCSQTSLYEADAHLQRSRTVRPVRAEQAKESRVGRHRRTCMWPLCRTQGRLLYVQVRLLCSDGQHVISLFAFFFFLDRLIDRPVFQDGGSRWTNIELRRNPEGLQSLERDHEACWQVLYNDRVQISSVNFDNFWEETAWLVLW